MLYGKNKVEIERNNNSREERDGRESGRWNEAERGQVYTYRDNSLWVYVSSIGTVLTVVVSSFSLYSFITQSAIQTERRFVVLEQRFEQVSEDIRELKSVIRNVENRELDERMPGRNTEGYGNPLNNP